MPDYLVYTDIHRKLKLIAMSYIIFIWSFNPCCP